MLVGDIRLADLKLRVGGRQGRDRFSSLYYAGHIYVTDQNAGTTVVSLRNHLAEEVCSTDGCPGKNAFMS